MKKVIVVAMILLPLLVKAQLDTVYFSASGGFYDNVLQLELSNINSNCHIHYTTNGNRPSAQSALYTEPLVLNESMYSKSDIYTIVNCPAEHFFPVDSVRHCIVVRAAVFDENDSCVSSIVTNSYFIGELGCDTHGLPAVSLCADSLDLFDYYTGILIPGFYYNPNNPYLTGNYFMKGREWERIINFEFYETDNEGLNQTVGLRTHGNQMRWKSQKGMKIYAREEYGKKRLRYKFFETIPNKSFKHLLLRPFMSSWLGAGCNDYVCGRLAETLDFESLASRPAVLFLNGEYWGVYYVAERPDERFLHDHLDVSIDSVNIMYGWYGEVDCGSPDDFLEFYDWMEQADLSQADQYDYAVSKIDINNFIDYYIFEMFIANRDWSNNNVRIWQTFGGKLRWIFYDGDSCFSYPDFDVFANAVYVGNDMYPSSTRSTLFFRRLYENYGFRLRFKERFEEMVATTLAYENTLPVYEYIKDALEGEIDNQVARFGSPPNSSSSWSTYNVYMVKKFLRDRPADIIEQLYGFLSVDETSAEEVLIYPNPADDCIYVNAEVLSCEVYDMVGELLKTAPANTEKIPVTDLRPGIYIVKFKMPDGGVVTQKTVKR